MHWLNKWYGVIALGFAGILLMHGSNNADEAGRSVTHHATAHQRGATRHVVTDETGSTVKEWMLTAPSGANDASRAVFSDNAPRVNQELESLEWSHDIQTLLQPLNLSQFAWNDDARTALQIFVERMPSDLDERNLDNLHREIQNTLRGDEGTYLAEVVLQLYALARAESQVFTREVPATMDGMLAEHEAREAFRKSFLGEELFYDVYGRVTGQSRAPAFESGGLHRRIVALQKEGASDQDVYRSLLEEEGRDAAEAYFGMQQNADWWHQRYEHFLKDRKLIDQAGLSLEDKEMLISELLANHYRSSEWNAAKSYIALQAAAVGQ
ncbi:MAG: lipase secretion chaperone [Oleiphilaceae bacterium]|nr:lipase secretion chaperone [Oleiphilaceae bacterium]